MTTDDELVERVAKAIHKAHRNAPYPWWHVEAEHCRVAPHLARAAIAAIGTEADRISLLREALEQGAEWFEEDAELHRRKTKSPMSAFELAHVLEKVGRDRERAAYLRQALASSGGGG